MIKTDTGKVTINSPFGKTGLKADLHCILECIFKHETLTKEEVTYIMEEAYKCSKDKEKYMKDLLSEIFDCIFKDSEEGDRK